MNGNTDTTKTLLFAGAALVLAGAAYFSQPRVAVQSADAADVGVRFFPDLTLEKIKGLEITDYDPKSAKTDMFRVEYEKGGWVLPLKEGYPADAKDALAKATSWLTSISRDVKLTADKTQHRELGVMNPLDEKGTEGVGILFRALDENKNVLAELIVGKEVDQKPGWRYVREPKGDVVYRANVGEFSVSTRFRDWIEKDLLELSDSVRTLSSASEKDREKFKKTIANVQWTEYKLAQGLQGVDIKGKTTENIKFTGGSEFAPQAELQGIAANQETNIEKVRDLSDALRNMQIVDVFAKPPGLGPDLRLAQRTGQITDADRQKIEELGQRGFLPTADQDVIPMGGELRVETKEGVFYRLRFGRRALISDEGKTISVQKDEDPAAKKDEKKDEKKDAKKDAKDEKADASKKGADDKPKEESRFVLIAVGFDESKLPPVVEPAEPKLPEPKPGEKVDEADRKKKLDEIRQLQKMQTEEARKKRAKDVENGKLRAKELADRYDRWYFVVSNDTFKRLKVDKATFAKAKEEKKDEKTPGSPPGIPGLPSDLSKGLPDLTGANPNVPAPPKKSEDAKKTDVKAKPASTKEAPKKDALAGKAQDAKTNPAKDASPPSQGKAGPTKDTGKSGDATKTKDPAPAKKPPTP